MRSWYAMVCSGLLISVGVPRPLKAQAMWRFWQTIVRTHPPDEVRAVADAIDTAFVVRVPGVVQKLVSSGNCHVSSAKWWGDAAKGRPSEVHTFDAGDLLSRTRLESDAQGRTLIWTYAGGRGDVVHYAGSAPKQYVDSFPIFLGAASDTAKVAERTRLFRTLLTTCEWRF